MLEIIRYIIKTLLKIKSLDDFQNNSTLNKKFIKNKFYQSKAKNISGFKVKTNGTVNNQR